MKDLDKLLAGKKIYRHEDMRAIASKWQGWADFLQFGSLGLLFISLFVLEALPKETARAVVWYWAGFMFVLATVAFFVAQKALKYKMGYLNSEGKRVGTLLDDAIERVKD